MNSITAMIFSLKAWPIRLLGYMNISAIACHFYKCVASRHGYLFPWCFNDNIYQRRGIQCISGHSWVQSNTRCALVVIFCVGRDNKFIKFQKLVMFWVCWWIEADSNSLIKLSKVCWWRIWLCSWVPESAMLRWVPIFSKSTFPFAICWWMKWMEDLFHSISFIL